MCKFILALSVLTPLLAVTAQADSATWTGSADSFWAKLDNWSGPPTAVPGTGNVATFNNSGNGITTIDLGAGVIVGGLSFETADAAAYALGSDTIQTLQLDHNSNTSVGAGVLADQTITARINLGTTANAVQIFNFSNASTEADLILGELVRRTNSVNQRRGAEVYVSGDGDVFMGQLRLEGTQSTGVMKLFKSGAGTLTLGQGLGDVDNRFTYLESLTAGTVVLNKASSATVHALGSGPNVINGGTLQLAGTGGNQMVDTGHVNITGTGIFDLNGRNEAINSLSGDATGMVLNTANSTQSIFTVGANGGAGNFDGIIVDNAGGAQTGTVALTKDGTGIQTLTGANTYTGPTAINNGTLSVTGSLAAGSAVIVNSPGALGGTGVVNGAVSGTGAIAPGVAGIGILTTGEVDLSVGTLAIGIDGASSGKLLSTGTITLGGTLQINLGAGEFSEASYVIAEGASIVGTFATVPSGYDVNYSATQVTLTSSAPFIWTGGADTTWANGGNWSGSSAGFPGAGNLAIFNGAGNGNTTIDVGPGMIFADAQRVAGIGFDTAAAAAYTVGAGAPGAQTLTVSANGGVSMSATVAEDQTFNVQLILGGTPNVDENFYFSNESTTNSLIFNGTIKRNTGAGAGAGRPGTMNISGAGDIQMDHVIRSGSGSSSAFMSIIKSGSGTLILGGTANNSLVRLGTLSEGTVILSKSGGTYALGAATHEVNGGNLLLSGTGGNLISDSGGLNITGGSFDLNGLSESISFLSGIGTGTVRNTANGTASVLTLGSADGSGDFAGVIADNAGGGQTGTIAIAKTGIGTAILSGTNTYTGSTTVDDGFLGVNGSLAAASTVTVNAAGTLAGTGTVNGMVGGSGSIAPGVAGIGTLTTGAADLSTASLVIGIDGASSGKLVSSGNIILGGPLVVNVGGSGFTEASYVIAEGSGLTGTFSSTPPGFTVNYTATQAILQFAPDPYLTWIDGFNDIPLDQRGPNDDPDADGVPNFLEFALNGDPGNGSNNGLLASLIQDSGAPAGNDLSLVMAVRNGATFGTGPDGVQTAMVDGLTYTVEGSLDLAFPTAAVSQAAGPSETAPAATGLPSLAGSDWKYHTFKLDASEGLTGKGFLRVSVAKP